MSPEVRDGDYVRVDPDVPAEPGRAVALQGGESGRAAAFRVVRQDGTCCREGRIRAFPDRRLDAPAEASALGVAVFAGRRI